MPTASEARVEPRRNLLLVCCGLAGLAFNGMMALGNSSTWSADFDQFYSAGKLVGSGHLYDWALIQRLEREHHTSVTPFIRMPVFAAGFKPLSALPYGLARILWLAIGIAAATGFVLFWPWRHRLRAWVILCWSAPVVMCLAFGQDTILLLLFVAVGMALLLRKRDFAAGLVLSLCASKPHLALLLPIFLAANRKWRCILGGLAGGAALLALSFAVEGPQWVTRYLALSRVPDFDPAPGRMPNLRGLLTSIRAGPGIEIGLALIVLMGVWFLARSIPLQAGAALALGGGLIAGHHGYFYDAVLLLPALALPFDAPAPDFIRRWAVLPITPIPYLLLLTGFAPAGQLVLIGYVFALGYALRPKLKWIPI